MPLALTPQQSWSERLALTARRLTQKRKVAFVLSGGGNLGAVQVGMLRALVEEGVVPDIVVGCSAGAINGAAFANEPTLRGVNRLERIWRRLANDDPPVMPRSRLPIGVQLFRKGDALHTADALGELLAQEIGADTFEQLQLPFHCVATEVESGAETWFSSGELVPALMASAALPAVFPPVEIQGTCYFDGGVVSELPVAHAAALGATEFYILQAGQLGVRSFAPERPFDVLIHAYWMARLDRLKEDLSALEAHHTVYHLPSGSRPRLRFDDFRHAHALIERSHLATSHYLRTGETLEAVDGPTTDDEAANESQEFGR